MHWNDPFWSNPSRPIIGVNWYEAFAYCKWLEEIYKENISNFNFIGNKEFSICLPTEAEWEKSAKGINEYKWPWGNNKTIKNANTIEQNLGTTTPVGIFPSGASGYGVMDMIGNVWEWTNSYWGKNNLNPDYLYPYDPSDGRENDPDTSELSIRVVRGSSWTSNLKNHGRSTFREWGFTYNCSTFSGFRIVLKIHDT